MAALSLFFQDMSRIPPFALGENTKRGGGEGHQEHLTRRKANEQGRQTEMIIYGGLALLFQPFFKIALGREIWNIVDVIVGLGLLARIYLRPKTENK